MDITNSHAARQSTTMQSAFNPARVLPPFPRCMIPALPAKRRRACSFVLLGREHGARVERTRGEARLLHRSQWPAQPHLLRRRPLVLAAHSGAGAAARGRRRGWVGLADEKVVPPVQHQPVEEQRGRRERDVDAQRSLGAGQAGRRQVSTEA